MREGPGGFGRRARGVSSKRRQAVKHGHLSVERIKIKSRQPQSWIRLDALMGGQGGSNLKLFSGRSGGRGMWKGLLK